MNTMILYLGAVTLCGFSAILIRETSPYSLSMGCIGERVSKRRFAGRILLFIAALFAGIGVLAQFLSSYH